jgi:hypothetical protein
MNKKVYQELAVRIQAIKNCQALGNSEWEIKHTEVLESLVDDYLPTGSGFDSGCSVDIESSTRNKIIILFDYHHMDSMRGYHHWQAYKVKVRPDFINGFSLDITGRDYNGFKEYAYEVFYNALTKIVES